MSPATPGDPAKWLDEHGDYLFGYAIQRLHDRDAAEDAVQETLLAALAARDSFAGRSSVRTWLVGILRHKIVDYVRRRVAEQPFTDLEGDDPITEEMFSERGWWKKKTVASAPSDWGGNPRKAYENKELREVLDRCLEALPRRLADAFTLREVDEVAAPEVCQVLEISATNLWVMLHRARMRLRQCLEVHWFGIQPSAIGRWLEKRRKKR